MTKHRLSIIEIIVQTIAFALLFIDNMFVSIKSSNYYLVGYYESYTHTRSFYEASIDDHSSDFAVFLGCFFIAIFLIYIILNIINLFKKIKFLNGKPSIAFPVVILALFAFIGIWLDSFLVSGNWTFQYGIKFLFVIELIVLAAGVVISIYKNFSALPNKNREPKTTNINDLEYLKDLLDKGIITQEEFDAKKKQLLDL